MKRAYVKKEEKSNTDNSSPDLGGSSQVEGSGASVCVCVCVRCQMVKRFCLSFRNGAAAL